MFGWKLCSKTRCIIGSFGTIQSGIKTSKIDFHCGPKLETYWHHKSFIKLRYLSCGSKMSVSVNSGDKKLDAAITDWLKLDKNPDTRKELLADIANKQWDKLKKTMLTRMKFGTAGLRGRMAPGYMCMNDVVILQTAQGLCSYLQKVCCQSQIKNGIVVGYDGRYNSKRFAELTAKVFISNDMPVHMFSKVVPTPFVSFGTIYYKAAGGVMVTASHNPKWDNGYKVYWGNGSQLLTPHDDNVLEEILNCLDIPSEHWCIENIESHELLKNCQDEVVTKYMEYIKDTLSEETLQTNQEAAINVVYSAMHGVGYQSVVEAFRAACLQPVISVKEQQDPNPDFPTADFPNPEERNCLDLSKKLTEECVKQGKDVKLVLVNDPDADRLAVAEYDDTTKSWKFFTGNEMGTLLGYWCLTQHRLRHGEGEVYIVVSAVSSQMLKSIVKGKGHFVQTLTGFKWMGNTTLALLQQEKKPIFAYEEAIGYMVSPRLPDKDGVSAAVHVASQASQLYCNGSTLLRQLNELYLQYGYHVSHNSYYICHDQAITTKIFERIRNFDGPGKYPTKVASCEIATVNDMKTGFKTPVKEQGGHLEVVGTGMDLEYTGGEMIMFTCTNGLSVMLRTSGTEPKLKYYTEMVYKIKDNSEQEAMKSKMVAMVKEFVEVLFEPKKNGLKAQGE